MQLAMHMVTIEDLMPQGALPPKAGGGAGSVLRVRGNSPALQQKIRPPGHRPGGHREVSAGGFPVRHPVGAADRAAASRPTSPCAGTWASTSSTGCRTTAPSRSCAAGNRPSARCFGGYLKKSWGSASKKVWSAGELVGTDSTHVRANASRASEELVEVAEEAGVYWERLDDYEEEGLEELERRTGKRRKKRTKQIKRDNRRIPQARQPHRPGGGSSEAPGEAGGTSLPRPSSGGR